MTLSVIVPVYQACSTLLESLAALQAQTCEGLQLVFVDDGSTDGSARLLDEAAAADERIVVIHQNNAGPAAARNAGLDVASGEWLAFADADDTMRPGYLAALLAAANATGADIVASDCMIEEAGTQRRFGMIIPDMFYTDRNDLYQDFLSDRIPWTLWAKLYRTSLFEGVRFDTADYIAEDLDLNARLFARPGLRLATTSECGYIYHVRDGSIDHSFTERHLCQFAVFERVVGLVHDEGIRTETSPEVFYEQRILNCLRKAIEADALTPPVRAAFTDALAAHRSDVLADPAATAALKLRMRASRLGPRVYAFLNRIHP